MADTKEALPVVAWRMNMMEFNDEARPMFHYAETPPEGDDNHFTWQALVKHATATAAIAELRAEVERLKADADRLDWLARRDLNALCLGYNEDAPGPYTVNGYPGRTFREAIDAARAGASQRTTPAAGVGDRDDA